MGRGRIERLGEGRKNTKIRKRKEMYKDQEKEGRIKRSGEGRKNKKIRKRKEDYKDKLKEDIMRIQWRKHHKRN